MILRPKPPKGSDDPPRIEVVGMTEGIRKAVGEARAIRERPGFIGVFGYPDSGKSHLINGLIDAMYEAGMVCAGFHCSVSGGTIRQIKERMDQDPHGLPAAFIFHCPYERTMILDADQESLLKLITGRGLDIAIGIYNPHIYQALEGEYDFVISNPLSRRKGT